MFWWFVRSGQHLRVEVLWLAADKFELRVIDADGTEHVEMFANPATWQSAKRGYRTLCPVRAGQVRMAG